MRATRPPVPHDASADTVVAAGRSLLDDALLGGDGSTRAGTSVTVSGSCAPARALTTVDGSLHVVLDPSWVWPSNADELVGVVQVREDDLSVSLVGWWRWHHATSTLRLDLACANVCAGPLTVALQDDDASTALLA